MIVDRYADSVASFHNIERHINVGLAGRRVAAGMIMGENDSSRFEGEAAFYDFSGVHWRAVNCTFAEDFVCYQSVFSIQKQDPKLLHRLKLHRGSAVIQQGIPTGKDRTAQNTFAGHMGADGVEQAKIQRRLFANAFDFS